MFSNEIVEAIAYHRQAAAEPISRLGYFCAPFQPKVGPLADKVIKLYMPVKDNERLTRLCALHDDYRDALQKAQVSIPTTQITTITTNDEVRPVIVQDALHPYTMMRTRMIEDSLAQSCQHLQAAAEVIARFWRHYETSARRIGFHPSIRNFAIINEQAVFFDTFPPLIDYTRDEMGELLLLFSEKQLMRLVGPFLKRRVTGIQDEWYSPAETFVGMIGSACRLRPNDAIEYLAWGRTWAETNMPKHYQEISKGLDSPPKLPSYWTGFRKLLGLQGAPNLRR